MSVICTIKNRGAGSRIIRLNGKRVGTFLFERDAKNMGLHHLTFPTAEAFNAVADELLTTPGNQPISIRVESEVAEADATLQPKLDEAAEKIASLLSENKDLNDRVTAFQNAPEGASVSDEETLSLLEERDTLLGLLQPLAGDGETPEQVLQRIIANQKKPRKKAEDTGDSETPAPDAE